MKQDMILILDLGSQENPALAREIRALGVYTEIHPHDISAQELQALPNVKGIILNGGPNRVVDGVEIDAGSHVYDCGIPVCPWTTRALPRCPRIPLPGKLRCGTSSSASARRRPTGTWRTSLPTRLS